MTKIQFMEKCKSLIYQSRNYLIDQCEKAYNSGALNISEAENDYYIPRIVISVALRNASREFGPVSPEGKEEASNLVKFV